METGQTGRQRDTTQRDKHRDRTTNILTRQDRERREPSKQDTERPDRHGSMTRETKDNTETRLGQTGHKRGTHIIKQEIKKYENK